MSGAVDGSRSRHRQPNEQLGDDSGRHADQGADAASLAVLVVHREREAFDALAAFLGRWGDRVEGVRNGDSAIRALSTATFDIVVLEVCLGTALNGFAVCRDLRARGNPIPIIMVSSLSSEADAVTGFEAGADDYVRTPVRHAELRSRIRAVLRRTQPPPRKDVAQTRIGRLLLDHETREVRLHGRPVALTFSEYEVLASLASDPGRVVRREELARAISGRAPSYDPRSVDAHVRRLRAKLETEPSAATVIRTVRGVGYKLQMGQSWLSAVPPLRTDDPVARDGAVVRSLPLPSAEGPSKLVAYV